MKNNLILLVILSITLLNLNLASSDEQLTTICGGDEELIIHCIGDEELNSLGLETTTSSSSQQSSDGTNIRSGLTGIQLLSFTLILFLIAIIITTILFIKEKKKKEALFNK